MTRRVLALGIALPIVGLAAAGCGGSRAPSVASLGTTSSTGTTPTPNADTAKPSSQALAACFTSHGFQATVGSAADAGAASVHLPGVTINGNVDPGSPQFQAAMKACRKYLPGGGPPALTPAQQAETAKAMTSFAACMRKHGVSNFPDPNSQGFFSVDSLKAIEPTSPLTERAFKACQPLEPKVGVHLVLP